MDYLSIPQYSLDILCIHNNGILAGMGKNSRVNFGVFIVCVL